MNKAYVYRLYPTADQKILFAKTFGCCRKIWNLMLGDRIDAYNDYGITLLPTPAWYKSDDRYSYLKEVDSLALANVQLDQQRSLSEVQVKTPFKAVIHYQQPGRDHLCCG